MGGGDAGSAVLLPRSFPRDYGSEAAKGPPEHAIVGDASGCDAVDYDEVPLEEGRRFLRGIDAGHANT